VSSVPRFLQGILPFTGHGLEKPAPLDPPLRYQVPDGVSAQAVYLRGGNSSDELVCLVLVRDGTPMRYFPVAARGATHVTLRVLEDLEAGATVELHLAAPEGTTGYVVADLGLVEV
jgi:assimilatory nitrate reductase catalytic subunit